MREMSSQADIGRTRRVALDMGQVRDRSLDVGTVIQSLDDLRPTRLPPFEALFLAHYRVLREIAREPTPGAAAVAVHMPTGRLAGRLWLAHRESPGAAIIGRHSECDLVLDDEGMSLRHLALIVPALGHEALAFTLHDLRSSSGLRGALGQPMGGASVLGAGFFSVGSYALFTFATGAPERWPELASEAWRQAVGQTTALQVVRADERAQNRSAWIGTRSSVSAIRGPVQTNACLLIDHEERVCTLSVAAGSRRERLALGDAALERGLLLGRYSRCDSGGIWKGDGVSRVHLLVLRIDGEVFAIDTASTNGVFSDALATEEARVVNLSRGGIAVLGDGLGTVSLAT